MVRIRNKTFSYHNFQYYLYFSLKYRHFRFSEVFNTNSLKEKVNALEFVEEHFEKDEKKASLDDIAIRRFLFLDNKIFLQYHYEDFYITATTREFIKPPKPTYGEEIRFDPNMTTSYKVNQHFKNQLVC